MTPVVTIDPDAESIYIHLVMGKVAKTYEPTGLTVTLDVDAKGELIGIEIIGISGLEKPK